MGQPVGANSSLKTWEGDQWKMGGGSTWGWFSYDPDLNLIYYGSGNPGTWNPVQRPGDNKWSMTIFARDATTGVAKWVYQMTPHDEWDYDGVNEMVLVDNLQVGNQRVAKALVAYGPQRLRLYAEPRERPAAGSASIRPGGELGDACRHGDRPAAGGQPILHPRPGRGHQHQEHLPRRARQQGPAAFRRSPKANLLFVPTNHVCMDYEPFRVSYTAGQPFIGATLSMYPPAGLGQHGQFIAWNPAPARSSGRSRSASRSGPARWPPRATSSSTARSRAT